MKKWVEGFTSDMTDIASSMRVTNATQEKIVALHKERESGEPTTERRAELDAEIEDLREQLRTQDKEREETVGKLNERTPWGKIG